MSPERKAEIERLRNLVFQEFGIKIDSDDPIFDFLRAELKVVDRLENLSSQSKEIHNSLIANQELLVHTALNIKINEKHFLEEIANVLTTVKNIVNNRKDSDSGIVDVDSDNILENVDSADKMNILVVMAGISIILQIISILK
jgi:hypothetical protein